MLRNRPHLPLWATTLGDLAALSAAAGLASLADPRAGQPLVLATFALCNVLAQFASRLHGSLRVVPYGELLLRVGASWLRTVLGVAALALIWPDALPRAPVVLVAAWSLPLLCVVRTATMGLRYFVRSHGRNLRFVVIAGTGETAQHAARSIEANPGWGYRVLGYVLADDGPGTAGDARLPVLGHHSDLPQLVQRHVIDEIVIAAPRSRMECIEQIAAMAETIGIRAHVIADFVPGTWRSVQAAQLDGHLMLTLTPFPDDHLRLLVKRGLDLAVAAVGLVVLAPWIAAIALAIKLGSKGPVFFAQPRAGLNGRLFSFYKFRTMVVGAEQLRADLLGRNEMDGPVFKIRDDPRITPIGRLLRRFSLDELPQLWNVLRGDMSLVGPRPLMPHEVARYETWHRRRMSMRPGLTCLWQISGRNRIDFDRWMRLDLEYIDNWSLRMDLKILVRTLPAVVSGRGAS